MEELNNNINLGKVTENDFKESTSITILRSVAEKNRKIKVRATESDKLPGLDGKLVIIDKNSFERIYVEIQVKTLPDNYNLKKPYSYSCDTKAINIVLYHITFNPVVIILVDETSKKVFWKLISQEYAKQLNIGTQKKKTINFSEDDLFEENIFINKLNNYCDSLFETISNKDSTQGLISSNIAKTDKEYVEIQKQVDRLNNIFDNELKYIKKLFFYDVWKFGISYIKSPTHSCFGIYPIIYGENETLIKKFDPRLKYYKMSIDFIKNVTLEDYIDEWIENIKKDYYLKTSLDVENLSNDILNELIFNFLDKLTINIKPIEDKEKRRTYYKDEDSIKNIINTIYGIEYFLENIIKTKDSPNPSNAVSLLTTVYNNTGKFILFNPFIQFNKNENILLSRYINQTNEPIPLRFLDSREDKIKLSLLALVELQKRHCTKVKRIWNKKDFHQCNVDFQNKDKIIRTGYSKDDLLINWKHFFDIITDNYNFVSNKVNNLSNSKLNEFHCIKIDKDSFGNYSNYIFKNNTFQAKIIDEDTKIDEENLLYKIKSNLESLFLLDTPLYEIVRILIYIERMKMNNYNITNSYINNFIELTELPIINYYLK